MFVVRKIISSKFKHNGQNIWQKLGWVSLHSQTSIRPDYNELRLGRAHLIKMVMKALMFRRWVIDYKKYLQGDAMDVAYDFINDSRAKMARPSVVRADWEQREGERAGGGGAKFLPSIWRAARPWPGPNNCLSEDFLAPTPRPRHKTLHPFEFKWEARQAGLEPLTRIALSKKQRYPFPYECWLETNSFPYGVGSF